MESIITAQQTLPAATASLDADLIRICAEHIANFTAYNADGGDLEPEDDPLWAAYMRTLNAICGAKPMTIDGIVAKARAAAVEFGEANGGHTPHGMAQRWAWDLVSDILRLHGRTGA